MEFRHRQDTIQRISRSHAGTTFRHRWHIHRETDQFCFTTTVFSEFQKFVFPIFDEFTSDTFLFFLLFPFSDIPNLLKLKLLLNFWARILSQIFNWISNLCLNKWKHSLCYQCCHNVPTNPFHKLLQRNNTQENRNIDLRNIV